MEPTDPSTGSVYARRRAALLARLPPRAVAVVGGKRQVHRNSDVEHRFRQCSDVLYLTGFEEPEALVVLAPGRPERFTLFVRPRDPERETWTGRRAGVEGATARYGADKAYAVAEIATELPKLLDGAEEVLYPIGGEEGPLDPLILKAIADLRAAERRGARAPGRVTDLSRELHELRLRKDPEGIAALRRAAAVTAEAHTAAMRAAREGVFEYEIEALIDYTFRRSGGFPGYGTIVGGGVNATILHYVDNREPLKRGDLLLVDAGCELGGFTADVTRTYPVGARFGQAQRDAYQIVLETEKRCIEMTRPGVTIDEIHRRAVELLTAGMVDLGLLTGKPSELVESGAFRRFYMHRTSHWLGLDVHDAGAYTSDGKARPLEPHMVFTVEPGLYVPPDAEDVPAELRGIGIRVEDDVLVTDGGHEVLTAAIPKEIDALEALTAG